MSYYVETAPSVLAYLESIEGLSDEGRAAIVDGYIADGEDADKFFALSPLGPESLHFRYDYPHPEGPLLYSLRLIIDGGPMEMDHDAGVCASSTPSGRSRPRMIGEG